MNEKAVYKYTLKREKTGLIREDCQLSSPDIAIGFIRSTGIASEEQEHLIAMVMDPKNNVKGYYTVTIGLADQTIVHAREIFRYAIINNASSIVLAHNHPSGNTNPSADDIRLTADMKEAGKIIGISLLDHVIISENSYFSFREKNMI